MSLCTGASRTEHSSLDEDLSLAAAAQAIRPVIQKPKKLPCIARPRITWTNMSMGKPDHNLSCSTSPCTNIAETSVEISCPPLPLCVVGALLPMPAWVWHHVRSGSFIFFLKLVVKSAGMSPSKALPPLCGPVGEGHEPNVNLDPEQTASTAPAHERDLTSTDVRDTDSAITSSAATSQVVHVATPVTRSQSELESAASQKFLSHTHSSSGTERDVELQMGIDTARSLARMSTPDMRTVDLMDALRTQRHDQETSDSPQQGEVAPESPPAIGADTVAALARMDTPDMSTVALMGELDTKRFEERFASKATGENSTDQVDANRNLEQRVSSTSAQWSLTDQLATSRPKGKELHATQSHVYGLADTMSYDRSRDTAQGLHDNAGAPVHLLHEICNGTLVSEKGSCVCQYCGCREWVCSSIQVVWYLQ